MDTSVNDPHLVPVNKKKLLLRQSVSEYDLARQVVVYTPQSRRPFQARNLASPLKRCETFSSFKEAAPQFTPQDITPEHTHDSFASDEVPTENTEEAPRKTHSYTYIFVALAGLAALFCTWDFQSIEESFCVKNFEEGEPDISAVHRELKTSLFGQPAAIHLITDSLTELKFTVNQLSILVLMGGIGTGKTWTNQLISKSLPPNVNKIWLHLEHWHKNEEVNATVNKLKPCTWNFVFVEDSDHAADHQVEAFVSVLKAFHQRLPSSPQKVVVFINSNSGQSELAQLLYEQLQKGGSRLNLTLSAMQQSLKGARSMLMNALDDSGFSYTTVPYPPLEKVHLRHCIVHDLKLKNKLASEKLIHSVMEHFKFYPKTSEYFSSTGCKSVSSHVNLYV